MFRVTVLPLLVVASCQAPPKEVKFEDVLRRDMARPLAPGREVIVSYVEIPPHTMLPWHWHPGEEYVYVVDGEVTAHVGTDEVHYKKGGSAAIPLRAVHTGSTGAKGARLVIFRVHVKGQPDRNPVEAPQGHGHPHE